MIRWVDDLFSGIKRVRAAGTDLPITKYLNFVGAGVSTEVNPTTGDIDVTIEGGGGSQSVIDTTTTTATPATLASFTVAKSSSVRLAANIEARNDASTVLKAWTLQAIALRGAAGAPVATLPPDALQTVKLLGADPGWSCTMDLSGNDLRIRGTGAAATTVKWHVTYEAHSSAAAVAPPPPGPVGAPTVTAVSPDLGGNNAGGPIEVTGTNFVTGATVSIGGVACTGVTVVSTTSITATLPATTAGSLAASVTTANGTGSRAGAYVALECAGLSYSLHYAGAGQTLTGSDVTAVADQGPTAKALTGVGTLPTLVASNAGYNNRATWNFADNTSSLDSAAFAISQPVTRFVVGHSSGVGALPHYLADGLSGYLGLSGSGTGGGGSAEMYAGGGYSISVDPTVKRVWTEQFSGATSRFSASSNTETVGTANASSPGGIRLGVTNTGGFGIGAAGALALQLQIYGTLTQGQRDTNRALLGAYYGITIV